LAWVAGCIPRWFARPKMVTHPGPDVDTPNVVNALCICVARQKKLDVVADGEWCRHSVRKFSDSTAVRSN